MKLLHITTAILLSLTLIGSSLAGPLVRSEKRKCEQKHGKNNKKYRDCVKKAREAERKFKKACLKGKDFEKYVSTAREKQLCCTMLNRVVAKKVAAGAVAANILTLGHAGHAGAFMGLGTAKKQFQRMKQLNCKEVRKLETQMKKNKKKKNKK